jgi:nucleoside-diphosphate-sugar epimerase
MNTSLFGSKGLIGSAIRKRLNRAEIDLNCIDFDWGKRQSYLNNEINLVDFIVDHNRLKHIELLAQSKYIILSLGITNVLSNENEVNDEAKLIKNIINDFSKVIPQDALIILITSGGGIFNSSSHTNDESSYDFRQTPYATMKLGLEEYLNNIAFQNKVRSLIIRLPNVYGEEQNINKGQGLVSKIVNAHRLGTTIEVTKNLDSQKHYILNHDVADGIYKYLQILETNKLNNVSLIHMIQQNSIYSIRNLIELSESLWGKSLSIKHTENLPYDTVLLSTRYTEYILPENQNAVKNFLKNQRDKHG